MAAILGVLILLLVTGPTASAQDRLFVGTREIGALGRFGADIGPAPSWLEFPRFGGDRYVLTNQGVVDLRTGTTLPRPEGYVFAVDRARPRVYVGRNDGVWAVDVATSFVVLALPGSIAGLSSCIHATSADVLFCAFVRPDGQHDIVRPGLAGPVLVGTVQFANSPFGIQGWGVSPDASRLFFSHCSQVLPTGFCVSPDIAMLNMVSGALIVGEPTDPLSSSQFVWDEVRERLFIVGTRVDVFDRELRPIGSATPGGRCRALAVSPHTGRVYLDVFDEYFSSRWAFLSAYDASTYRLLEPNVRRTTGTACGSVHLLTAPGIPRDVRARVTGNTIDLGWTNIGAASNFVLDVGFAPRRTDLSLSLGAEPRAFFTNVPSGTYYLRLRGGNEHGGGRPSQEVVVSVP